MDHLNEENGLKLVCKCISTIASKKVDALMFSFAFHFILGTAAYDKLQSILLKTGLVNGIKKLSPDAQTSCLEGFHATLNHWHPKMICFSWMGTMCRQVICEIYFTNMSTAIFILTIFFPSLDTFLPVCTLMRICIVKPENQLMVPVT